MIVPILFFILTNFVINGNSILLAFEKYEGYDISFAGFENFANLFKDFATVPTFFEMLWRSVFVYVIATIICTFVSIIFSYYVYKKLFGWKIFKVILFIPTILSSIITVSMFKMIANEVVPKVMLTTFGVKVNPLLSNPNTTFNTLLFYSVWMGLGGGLLTQLAAMNTVDPSVSESAQIEGISFFGELWHIVLPVCYEVLALGIIMGIASIFTNTMNLYAFYGTGAPENSRLIGYYFQIRTLEAEIFEYPYLSAWGIVVTLIVTPLTLGLRYLINRYGPSEETYEKKKKFARK